MALYVAPMALYGTPDTQEPNEREMPDVRYVGRGSLGYWEVIDKDNILI